MLSVDFGQQLEISIRLLVASVLGAAIGLERELNDHPAGMRTHLLVALGSAAFTVLSIFFFQAPAGPDGTSPTDPSRIAAQIVTGIGFLGAGAILKYGASVRGLTTAASLWATAGVGMASGAGAWLVALTTTILIVFSLGPLNWVMGRIRIRRGDVFKVQVMAGRLEALGEISRVLNISRVDIAGVNSQRVGKGQYEIELDLRPPAGTKREAIIATLSAVPGVEIPETGSASE